MTSVYEGADLDEWLSHFFPVETMKEIVRKVLKGKLVLDFNSLRYIYRNPTNFFAELQKEIPSAFEVLEGIFKEAAFLTKAWENETFAQRESVVKMAATATATVATAVGMVIATAVEEDQLGKICEAHPFVPMTPTTPIKTNNVGCSIKTGIEQKQSAYEISTHFQEIMKIGLSETQCKYLASRCSDTNSAIDYYLQHMTEIQNLKDDACMSKPVEMQILSPFQRDIQKTFQDNNEDIDLEQVMVLSSRALNLRSTLEALEYYRSHMKVHNPNLQKILSPPCPPTLKSAISDHLQTIGISLSEAQCEFLASRCSSAPVALDYYFQNMTLVDSAKDSNVQKLINSSQAVSFTASQVVSYTACKELSMMLEEPDNTLVGAFLKDLKSYEQRMTKLANSISEHAKFMPLDIVNRFDELKDSLVQLIPFAINGIKDMRTQGKSTSQIEKRLEMSRDQFKQFQPEESELSKIESYVDMKSKVIIRLYYLGFNVMGSEDEERLAECTTSRNHGLIYTFRFTPPYDLSGQHSVSPREPEWGGDFSTLFDEHLEVLQVIKEEMHSEIPSPDLYAVDMDFLSFPNSTLRGQMHHFYGGVCKTHDILSDWKAQCCFPQAQLDSLVPAIDEREILSLFGSSTNVCREISSVSSTNPQVMRTMRQALENASIRYEAEGFFPGKKFKLAIECPNERCKGKGCPLWKCMNCETIIELVVRSDSVKDSRGQKFPDVLICSKCCLVTLPKNAQFRCQSVTTHGTSFSPYYDENKLEALIQVMKDNVLNIVIMGATGVGKSTFINAFANYLQSNNLQEMIDNPNKVVSLMATEFSMTDEKSGELKLCKFGELSQEEQQAVKTPGASFTQTCQCYSMNIGTVTLRLIDTPGLVDTRGVDQDNININNIMSFLSHFETVHAFLFLFKGDDKRLDSAFKYCFKALLNKLHREASENIIFVNTNSRSGFYRPAGTAPLLDSLLTEVRRETGIKLKRQWLQNDSEITTSNDFYIDSEAFRLLVAQRNGIEFTPKIIKEYSESWDHSAGTCSAIFARVKSQKAHDTAITLSIHKVQMVYQALSMPMGELQAKIHANMRRANDERTLLRQRQLSIDELEARKMIKRNVLETIELPHPKTVCVHPDCTSLEMNAEGISYRVYKTACHNPCSLPPNYNVQGHEVLMQCHAFGCSGIEGTPCNNCGHTYKDHMHSNLDYRQVVREFEDTTIVTQINEGKSAGDIQQARVNTLEEEIRGLEEAKRNIEDVSVKMVCYLKKNSLVPFNDSLITYLDAEIALRERASHDDPHLEQLRGWKRTHQEAIRMFEARLKTADEDECKEMSADDIQRNMDTLFNLPEHGIELKRAYDAIIAKDSMQYTEKSCPVCPAIYSYSRGRSRRNWAEPIPQYCGSSGSSSSSSSSGSSRRRLYSNSSSSSSSSSSRSWGEGMWDWTMGRFGY